MDNNNFGPQPGILPISDDNGQSSTTDTPQTIGGDMPQTIGGDMPNPDNQKIFDSSEVTGVKTEDPVSAIPTVGDKPKKQNSGDAFYKNWKLWAIACLVIFLSSGTAITIMLITINGGASNSELAAEYDSKAQITRDAEERFKLTFEEKYKTSYGLEYSSMYAYQPEENQKTAAYNNCIKRFGATDEAIALYNERKSGSEIAKNGDIKKAKEKLDAMSGAFASGTTNIDLCSDDILAPVYELFEITIGDIQKKDSSTISGYASLSREVTVKNKSSQTFSRVSFNFDIVDKNGVASNSYASVNTSKDLAPGESFTGDLYSGIYSLNGDTMDNTTAKLSKVSIGVSWN